VGRPCWSANLASRQHRDRPGHRRERCRRGPRRRRRVVSTPNVMPTSRAGTSTESVPPIDAGVHLAVDDETLGGGAHRIGVVDRRDRVEEFALLDERPRAERDAKVVHGQRSEAGIVGLPSPFAGAAQACIHPGSDREDQRDRGHRDPVRPEVAPRPSAATSPASGSTDAAVVTIADHRCRPCRRPADRRPRSGRSTARSPGRRHGRSPGCG
jgi:hypothetical protein